jgi:hypothetical protein
MNGGKELKLAATTAFVFASEREEVMTAGMLYEAHNGTFWVASDVVTPFDPSTGKWRSHSIRFL